MKTNAGMLVKANTFRRDRHWFGSKSKLQGKKFTAFGEHRTLSSHAGTGGQIWCNDGAQDHATALMSTNTTFDHSEDVRWKSTLPFSSKSTLFVSSNRHYLGRNQRFWSNEYALVQTNYLVGLVNSNTLHLRTFEATTTYLDL